MQAACNINWVHLHPSVFQRQLGLIFLNAKVGVGMFLKAQQSVFQRQLDLIYMEASMGVRMLLNAPLSIFQRHFRLIFLNANVGLRMLLNAQPSVFQRQLGLILLKATESARVPPTSTTTAPRMSASLAMRNHIMAGCGEAREQHISGLDKY